MQTSSQPKLLPIPFANGGSKQDIPNDSQVGITAGRASYTDGFPPLTRTPLAAGGVPPFGTDFNGVLNDITAAVRWAQAGAGYPFNATFNTAITGFPKGAKIPNSTFDGFWLNTTDGNAVNPENTTSALTGWVPTGFYGVAALTGLAGSSVTLTTLQAGRDRITLAGALTANINLVVPAWIKRWEIINNCTGAFSVTVKTPSGTGIAVPAGVSAILQGDGTNVVRGSTPGALLNVQVFTSSGTYTPTSGAKTIIVEVQGGGGGGGSNANTSGSSTSASAAGGGGGGSYGKAQMTAQTYAVTVGTGGAGGAATSSTTTGNAGTSGGDSTFGSVTAYGGLGGSAGVPVASLPSAGNTSGYAAMPSGNLIVGYRGDIGIRPMMYSASAAVSGGGGRSMYSSAVDGRYAQPVAGAYSVAGYDAFGYGGGGSGSASISGSGGISAKGGNGMSGIIIIWEYA